VRFSTPPVLAAVALILAALAVLSQAAQAFRGANGEIAYSSEGSVYKINPDGTDRIDLSAGGGDSDPAVSPLGLRIAFERDTTSTNRDIWVMHSDGAGQRRLTRASAVDEDPAWSPDGTKVAWMRSVSGNRDIHTTNADGSGVKRVTTASYADYSPAWSHGGKIAFVRNRSGNHDIYTMNADGSGIRRVTSLSAQDTSPSWSPDSTKIAFVRSGDVYTVKPDGTGLQRLTTAGGGLDPSFSPDGSKIAFVRGAPGDREVYVMNADGTGAEKVTNGAADARDPDWQAKGHDPVIAAAGDIACDPASVYFNGGVGTNTECRERYTANVLLNTESNKVVNLGDNQYSDGSLSQFRASYDHNWGMAALKSITAPSVGNHEYRTPNASDYFDYFNGTGNSTGPAGNRDKGYYSYDIGENWHVVVLNSDCGYALPTANVPGGCGAGSPQEEWLRADLAANDRPCTLAYFHHPHFRLGTDSATGLQEAFWDALYEAGAELVLNGHLHNYQRAAPQDPSGKLDTVRGIRQFVVGTGGKNVSGTGGPPNTEKFDNGTFGVLKVTLRPDSYRWEFLPEAGKTFTDSGTTGCHAKPSQTSLSLAAAPSDLTAANGDGKVSLDWSHAAEAHLSGYNVYRSAGQGGPYTKMNASLVAASEYTDSDVINGNQYYYVVKAVDKSGNESGASNEVSANPASTPNYRDKVFATSGLVSYWRLGEVTGTRAADEKGAYPGTYAGGVSLGHQGAFSSDANTASRFDGSDDEMTAGGSRLALTTTGTLEGWFNWEAGTSLLRDTTSGAGWILAYDSGGSLAYRVGGTSFTTGRTTASVKNGWHHFALSVSGGNTALYIGGELVHTGSGAGTTAAQMPWHLMRNGIYSSQSTRGLADEVAIYDQPLSSGTLQEHYRAGNP